MTSTVSDNNRRIARNTLFLYIRMLLMMGVSLYTSRVVLEQLGVVDYGVFNVVGGIVAMLGFLNGAISAATQRFLSVSIAENDGQKLTQTFQTIQAIQFIIAGIVFVLAETVGLWFLYNYINIPQESFIAATWVYQCSIVIAIIGIFTVPYTSLTIAHEQMDVYAYLSLLEVFLKLSVAFLLIWIYFEKLILYSLLVLASSVVTFLVWVIYTRNKYSKIKFSPLYDKTISKGIFKFVGWQTYGSFSLILRTQGINILLNIFFGPVLNAARGIAVQVNMAMIQFVQNFQMAVVPQINKQYAVGDYDNVNNLIMRSSKFSFLLMFILALPVLMETRAILEIWLKDIPEYSVVFVQLIITSTLTDLMSGTLVYGALATGNIGKYQLVLSSVFIISLPLTYFMYKLGYSPQALFYIEMSLNILCLFIRLAFLRRMTELQSMIFIRNVTIPSLIVATLSLVLSIILKKTIPSDMIGICVVITVSFLIAIFFSYFIGLNRAEKSWAITLIRNKIK